MGKYQRIILASAISLICQKIQSQNNFATIEQNQNVEAKDLFHKLNPTQDTLILKGPKIIDYVYSLNSAHKKELNLYNNTNFLKIPLTKLSKGKHVFVVGYSKMMVVFVVRVLKEYKSIALLSKPNVDISNN